MPVFRTLIVSLATSLMGGAVLHGQQFMSPPVGDPVDRAVVDIDPLSAQMRSVERGLSHAYPFQYDFYAQHPHFNMPVNPQIAGEMPGRTRQYYFEMPGVRAWIPRPHYVVRESSDFFDDRITHDRHPIFDNEFVAMSPADTVYDLIPRPAMQPAHIPIITGADGQQFIQQIDPQPDFLVGRPINTQVQMDPFDPRMTTYRTPLEVVPPQPMEQELSLTDKVRAIAQAQQAQNQAKVMEARREQWIRMRKELAAERGLIFDPQTGETRAPRPGETVAAPGSEKGEAGDAE